MYCCIEGPIKYKNPELINKIKSHVLFIKIYTIKTIYQQNNNIINPLLFINFFLINNNFYFGPDFYFLLWQSLVNSQIYIFPHLIINYNN